MRGPELHTLLVIRPDPIAGGAGRTPASGAGEAPQTSPDRSGDAREGIASRRQFASGGYQVHNGRPAAPVVIG
jgi:hypothetical protein